MIKSISMFGESQPFFYHSNTNQTEINYGPGTCYFIPSYRGHADIDNDAFVEYLKSLDGSTRLADNQSDVKYQDIALDWHDDVSKGPTNPEAGALASQIINAVAEWTSHQVSAVGHMWTIRHGYCHQTYPHMHDDDMENKMKWACVYWAQVPENSGILELYPNGMGRYSTSVHVTPRVGDFFVFPGDLMHGVRQNLNKDEERISVSFNMYSFSPGDFVFDEDMEQFPNVVRSVRLNEDGSFDQVDERVSDSV